MHVSKKVVCSCCLLLQVVEFLHVKPGKGAAFVRSKMKNYLTGGVVEKTFRAGEMLNVPDLSRREAQFTYAEGGEYVFMDNETYEETRLKRDDWANFLKVRQYAPRACTAACRSTPPRMHRKPTLGGPTLPTGGGDLRAALLQRQGQC